MGYIELNVLNNAAQPTANFFAGTAGTRQLELEVRRPANCTGLVGAFRTTTAQSPPSPPPGLTRRQQGA